MNLNKALAVLRVAVMQLHQSQGWTRCPCPCTCILSTQAARLDLPPFRRNRNSRSTAQARHDRWREFLSPQGLDGYKEDLAAESPPFRLQWRDTCRAIYHDWEFRFWDKVRLCLQKKLKVFLTFFLEYAQSPDV